MHKICRVYISDSDSLRAFYWFEYSEDNSVYFGSSNRKHFRTGYAGAATSSATGPVRIEPARDGRRMGTNELGQKTSIHGSGVVNASTVAYGRRERSAIAPPRNGFSYLPLVAVLPMRPTSYPISKKIPKTGDIIIEVGISVSIPFGSMFYLNATEHLEPAVILKVKSRYQTLITKSVPFGPYCLCVSIYADSLHMQHWPQLEGSLQALPEIPGGKPNWPFFANTNPNN